MMFYDSAGFYSPVTESPYIVDLNQELFVQLSLNSSDSLLTIFVDTCTAFPSPNEFSYPSYNLIRNGCVRDPTYVSLSNNSYNFARFKFRAFRFIDYSSSVYLKCKVVVCQRNDYSSRCFQGCQPRRKRALSSSNEQFSVVVGAIQLRDNKQAVPTIGYTAQGGGDSCNGLCSSFASNCSCEYSCGYNNNCCPDFCDFCPYVNFDVPVEGSCNGICTGWAGNCSCDYYCTYNNSCCPDFCDYCTYVNSGKFYILLLMSCSVFSDSDITCSSYFMTVKLHQPYIWSLGYNASDLHLDDAACTPQIFGSIILFKFPLNECGTNRKAVNGTIIYSNNVRSSPSNGLITRETYLRLNVQCKMEQEAITDIMYQANGGITANETGTGTYNISMVFYHGDFTSPVLENPYIVDLNEDIFVQIMLYTSDYLEVFIDTCTASPSQFGYPSYDLIRDGCVRDDTFVAFPSTSFDIARFRFNAFKFVDYSSSVYLECKVVLCQMYDYSSRCNRGCQARRRRDLSSSKDKVDVVSGRIELRKYKNFAEENIKLKKEEVSKISSTQTLVWISMTALATTTAILAFFTLKFYKKTTKDEWRL
ncbi:CUZD1 protein, partial [Polypterus senegalus]